MGPRWLTSSPSGDQWAGRRPRVLAASIAAAATQPKAMLQRIAEPDVASGERSTAIRHVANPQAAGGRGGGEQHQQKQAERDQRKQPPGDAA